MPAYGRALIELVVFLGASGRGRPEILKYRPSFNISRPMSEGVALFRNNVAIKINNKCAINPRKRVNP